MTDFERLYITWYARVKNFALVYVKREADAEDIVQDVFARIYEREDLFNKDINITSYLFISVKHACLNHLRERLTVSEAYSKYYETQRLEMQLMYDSLEQLDMNFSDESIETMLENAINHLPDKCRQIFIMSKLKGTKQKAIAQELGVSVNTVEVQMSIAYKKLREELKNCIPLLAFLYMMP
ncbi:RNA polymerase sigma-70 factor [Prevotella sp. S7 MS 2]|uniref:RNA polymerase sigma-70 factor n=1 Tax=Prevotella sp. S7 MS 2 TaxID=1287488 RepID=UPI0005130E9B|nr:RNA polymerase sigma-70 factor [Prevotella sp. S7 MS 2]KGI60994.1 RNA polymerase sigma70 factor [Prevotella sp. S7 MS 2]